MMTAVIQASGLVSGLLGRGQVYTPQMVVDGRREMVGSDRNAVLAALRDAQPHAVAMAPHNYNSTTMALSATVHASACMPNFIITEYFLPFEELGQRLCPNVLKPVDGYIALPEGPGFGIDVDEQAVRAAKGKQFPARTLRSLEDEGP